MNLYVTRNGQQLGPYSLEEARRLRAEGKIGDTDWAWAEGMADWKPLGEIPGIAVSPPGAPALPPVVPTPPGAMPAAAADGSLIWRRLATAAVLFVGLYVVLFILIFFVAVIVGVQMTGMQPTGGNPQTFDQGYKLGQEAGRKFGAQYGSLLIGIDAVVTLFVAGGAAFAVAFSRLLPWCRPRA